MQGSIGQLGKISIHALREEGDVMPFADHLRLINFYPRPPRGGRPDESATEELIRAISIHALREEGDKDDRLSGNPNQIFLSTPSARRATVTAGVVLLHLQISIHALREEGDSKNGEKHLRFCFIIKRSAQIWKSLSKNIRKNSCDLHRMA